MKIENNKEKVIITHSDEEIRACFKDPKKLELIIIMDTIINAASDLLNLIMDYKEENNE